LSHAKAQRDVLYFGNTTWDRAGTGIHADEAGALLEDRRVPKLELGNEV